MNLNENIQRIKILMEVEEDEKLQKVIKISNNFFDKIFDNLDIEKNEDGEYVMWYDKRLDNRDDSNMSVHKNYWGMFWFSDCNIYDDIVRLAKMVSISEEQIMNLFKDYLNKKYTSVFLDRPIQVINNEDCYDDFFND